MFINPTSLINKAVQAVTGSDSNDNDNSSDSQPITTEGGFDGFLKAVLGKEGQHNVSEEELFAALLQERVASTQGEEAAIAFNDLFEAHKSSLQQAKGFVPFEDAAKNALRDLRDQELISAEDADKVYSEAFSAAQLDGNVTALFDDRGGDNDPTIAVQVLEQALLASRVKIEQFDAGEESAEIRSLDEASNSKASSLPLATASATISGPQASTNFNDGTRNDPDVALALTTPQGSVVDGANGFLFKPISDNQGTLAVLVPEALAYKVAGVLLRDSNGTVVDEGYSTGYGELGTREKFSFSKRGGDYPKNLTVELHLLDGSISRYSIPDPSQRYD